MMQPTSCGLPMVPCSIAAASPLFLIMTNDSNDTEYMLERLKVLCEEVIVEAVTEENVVQLLEAAESYRARHLRAACIGFLAGRPAILPLPPTIQSDLRVLLL